MVRAKFTKLSTQNSIKLKVHADLALHWVPASHFGHPTTPRLTPRSPGFLSKFGVGALQAGFYLGTAIFVSFVCAGVGLLSSRVVVMTLMHGALRPI